MPGMAPTEMCLDGSSMRPYSCCAVVRKKSVRRALVTKKKLGRVSREERHSGHRGREIYWNGVCWRHPSGRVMKQRVLSMSSGHLFPLATFPSFETVTVVPLLSPPRETLSAVSARSVLPPVAWRAPVVSCCGVYAADQGVSRRAGRRRPEGPREHNAARLRGSVNRNAVRACRIPSARKDRRRARAWWARGRERARDGAVAQWRIVSGIGHHLQV